MVDEFAGMNEAEDNAEPALVAPGGEEKEESSAMLNADPVCQGTSKDVEDVVSATSAPAGAIRPIGRGVVHQICSGQVCYDLGDTLLIYYWLRSCSLSPPPSRSCLRTALTLALPPLISDLLSMAVC